MKTKKYGPRGRRMSTEHNVRAWESFLARRKERVGRAA